MRYDWLIVGAGISGCVFANEMKARGHKVLVIEKRGHIGGNVYTETVGGIRVHRYDAHIFHTNDREVWDYVNRYAKFNRFTNAPLAKFENKLYHLPFNMNTFYEMWGVTSPHEAREILDRQWAEVCGEPRNLEEQELLMVGRDIYEKLIKGYTEKQWGRSATELPASIILRLPVRFTFDNNYFNDCWQGILRGGYTIHRQTAGRRRSPVAYRFYTGTQCSFGYCGSDIVYGNDWQLFSFLLRTLGIQKPAV